MAETKVKNDVAESFPNIYQVLAQVASGQTGMAAGKQLWRKWLLHLPPEDRATFIGLRNDIARRMMQAAEGLAQDLQSHTE